jgi:hypothetical protein
VASLEPKYIYVPAEVTTRQVQNGVTISCQTRPFATKFFFDSKKRVSLVFSADGNTIVFWPF